MDQFEILDEQRFPYEKMSLEEKKYYLELLRNCKDISDSEHKVGNISKCEIVEMRLKKHNKEILINGSLTIGNDNIRENRCVDGYIFKEKGAIFVDMHVIRLCTTSPNREYTVLDEFKIDSGKLKRTSHYNYNMKGIVSDLEDDIMKGRKK